MSEPKTAAFPRTEIGESFLVNAEWHGPRCASNRTGMYRDCDCTLIREIVALEREAAAQAEGSLDVERLAEAIHRGEHQVGLSIQECDHPRELWVEVAQEVAAEYTRLAAGEHSDARSQEEASEVRSE